MSCFELVVLSQLPIGHTLLSISVGGTDILSSSILCKQDDNAAERGVWRWGQDERAFGGEKKVSPLLYPNSFLNIL